MLLTLASVPWQVIKAQDVLPVFSTQPAVLTKTVEGKGLIMNVFATGTNISYQWQYSPNQSGPFVNVIGQTSTQLNFSMIKIEDAGWYRQVATNSAGSIASSPGEIQVSAASGAPSPVVLSATTTAVTSGNSTTLSINLNNQGDLPTKIQWYKNNSPVSSSSGSSLVISGATILDAGDYYCLLSNSKGSFTTNVVTITVSNPSTAPTITIPSGPAFRSNPKEGFVYTIKSTASGASSFKWFKDGVEIPGQTGPEFQKVWELTDYGTFYCIATNEVGSTQSNNFVLLPTQIIAVTQVPTLTYPFYTTTVDEGQLLKIPFGVNNGATSIKWFKDEIEIPGFTSATFAKVAAEGDAGKYKIVATNAKGSITSNEITVNVNVLITPPAITTHPLSQNVYEGSSLNLSIVAAGGNLTYQWKKNGIAISGATAAIYTVAKALTTEAGDYTCTVTNSKGEATSNAAIITVSILAPTITKQPQGLTISDNAAFNLSVVAVGSNLTYQWRKDGVDIAGATTASYSKTNAALADGGVYTCVVTNSAGSITSDPASLVVSMLAPNIKAQPVAITVKEHETITLSVEAVGSNLTYQWKKDGVNIQGATATSYTKSGALLTDAGSYVCIIANQLGSVTSDAVPVAVTMIAPTITTQPVSQLITEKQPFTLNVIATGTNISYQWKKDGTDITGATSAIYSRANASAVDQGNYTCVVTNAAGSVTSDVTQLSISLLVPVITEQPLSQDVVEKDSVIFSIKSIGTNVVYQWAKNGNPIAEATSSTLKLKNITMEDAASYTCTVSNASGTITSSVAVLSVAKEALLPIIFGLKRQYAKLDPRILLVSKGQESSKLTRWFVDDKEVKKVDNAYYFYPADYTIGKHVIKTQSADGKLTIERTVTITE